MKHAIKIIDLTKIFRSDGRNIKALSNINLSIESGQIAGLVGANGAGKTTLLKIIAGLLIQSSGIVRINKDIYPDPGIGWLPADSRCLHWRLTGLQNLVFFGRFYGMSEKNITERTNYLMSKFGLENSRDTLAGLYSSGMRQKLNIIRSILHEPQILLFDEPFISMDEDGIELANRLIQDYSGKNNRLVFIATARERQIKNIVGRIIYMEKGEIVKNV
ncbi:MAG: ABC transporter ATP-binding protein [bacterium]